MIRLLSYVFFFTSFLHLFAEIKVEVKKVKGKHIFYAINEFHGPLTMTFDLKLTNLTSPKENTYICPAKSKTKLFSIEKLDPSKKNSYSYSYTCVLGNKLAKHQVKANYNLPFKKGSKIPGGQGFFGKLSHQGKSSYAVDFLVPEGTAVYPARTGKVVRVVEKFTEGGIIKKLFVNKANRVLILHDDQTIGRYFHFQANKIEVEEGDLVTRNTLLGFSGNTGYSTKAHLHFEVGIPESGKVFKSIEFYFSDSEGRQFTTEPKQSYYVDN